MSTHTNEVQLLPNRGWDERILACQNGKLVTTFIVVTQRYVVLVDTVINPATAQAMLDYAQPYLQGGRQLLVINTHADYDHAWGNQLFAGPTAQYPAPLIGSRLCAELMKAPEIDHLIERQQREPAIFGEVVLTPPTLTFDSELTIDGGDLTLQLFPTPGHTVDHISIYIPEITTLLVGDAGEVPYPAARTPDGLPVMRQSLAKLAAFPATHALYCHAPMTIGPQLLHDNIAYFNAIEAHCRAALARGGPAQPAAEVDVAQLIGLSYEQATPHNEYWQDVHEWYRTKGHAEQIRTMLGQLGQTNA